jgi:hypothetical protein
MRTKTEGYKHLPTLGDRPPERKIVIYLDGDQDRILHEADQALAQEPTLYNQAGKLVLVGRGMVAPEETTGAPILVHACPEYLAALLASIIEFRKPSRSRNRDDEDVQAGVPSWLPHRLLGVAVDQKFSSVKPITGLLSGPTVGDDGALIVNVGYHRIAGQGWYLADDFGEAESMVPMAPTIAHARAAEAKIRSMVQFFPWADEHSYGLWLTTLIAQLMRPSFGLLPASLISATGPGAGKTYLARLIGIICHRRNPALSAWPVGFGGESETELEKILIGEALSGTTLSIFDNLPAGTEFDSAKLNAVVTTPQIKGRILGRNENRLLPWWAQIVATGNSTNPTGDMAQRTMVIRLASHSTNARDRPASSFEGVGDAVDYASEHQSELLAAALTMCAAYARAGKPKQYGRDWGTFTSFVKGPLAIVRWVLGADPIAALFAENAKSDSVTAALEAIANNWAEAVGLAFHAKPIALKALLDIITGPTANESADALLEGFQSLGMHHPTAQALSRVFTRYAGRPIHTEAGTVMLASELDTRNKVKRWHIAPVTSSAKAASSF